jgi:hypothetical protein
MSQRFDTDVMDDLFYETAEGPAQMRYDEFAEFDAGEDEFDEFADGFEEMDEFGEAEEYDAMDALDAMEEAVTDALGADDTDEFFRRLARGVGRAARGAVRVARRVAPVVGRIARTVAPIASAIPLPWTQALGRVAGVVGRLAADEADEFEALDEMLDWAEDEDAIDLAAPVIAGLTIRSSMPGVSRLPRATRRQLVRSVTRSTQTLAQRQGPQAARAMPRVVQSVQRTARRRGLPARAMPQAVRRAATQVARSPRLVRQLARPVSPARARGGMARGGIAPSGGSCPTCGRRRLYTLRGPVRLSIRGQ